MAESLLSGAGGSQTVAALGMAQQRISEWAGIHGAVAQGDIELARSRMSASNAYQSEVENKINARLALKDATAVRLLGLDQASRRKSQSRFSQASQRARFAGQGVEATSGSAASVIEEEALIGDLDAIVIENNARRAAMGLEQDSLAYSRKARAFSFLQEEEMIAGHSRRGQQQLIAGAMMATHFGNVASDLSKLSSMG